MYQNYLQVHFASTKSDPKITTHAVRRVKLSFVQVNMPLCAKQYTAHFGGVDHLNTLHSRKYGQIARPSKKKTWKYLFWFLVNAAIVNAWILYKQTSKRPKRKKKYEHCDFM